MKNILEDKELNILNHSCAHLMAQAIKRIYPKALFWVGPTIKEGFYYDFDLIDDVIKEEDLINIEKEMKKIAKDGKRITKIDVSKEEAIKIFENNPYKLDLISNIDSNICIYKQDEFVDLCSGPHVETVKEIKYFKLLKTSGAYFKGDSKNKMLQRIYGICFSNEEDLNEYLNMLEEAKKRDHRKLGKDLELFMINDFGPGFPFFLPKGMIIRNALENFWFEEHAKEGYEFIKTPMILNKELWITSGHWDNYRDNMYTTKIDDNEFAIKPMNCPGSMLVYKNSIHSYKDLPIKVGELGLVHRHEASGALSGLFRVRAFTQDDAHIFMRYDQVEEEIIKLINFIDRIYKTFNLTYSIELSTRPKEKFIGTIEEWDKAEQILANSCNKANQEYKINEGDGAFYGPKLDFHIKDSLNRVWQCGTIQLDNNLSERFDLNYIEKDGTKKRPIMLHRVIYGSIERFIGILIEHYAGAFPLWLAPIQINILPVNVTLHKNYSKELINIIEKELIKYGINNSRIQVNDKEETLNYRIRESQEQKIPYTLIIGDKEMNNSEISFRHFGSENTKTLKLEEFINLIAKEIKDKK